MPYSYAVYTGNGATTQYAVPFPYIRKEHVVASINRVATTAFTWVNDSTVQFNTAPANAARVEIRRVTPVNNPLVDFADGSTLVAADLDTNALQQTYINQEQDDQIQDGVFVNSVGNLDAGGKRLVNLANPVDAQDAVTKTWVETSTSAPLVQFRSLFYGAFPTDQATDPYGGAPTAGDQYFNITSNVMRVWNGATWQDSKVADGAITTAKIADANVTTAKVADGAVTTAKVADGAVTNAKLATGRMTLETAAASTSGTEVNFGSIPSWAKKIIVMFNGVSTSGTSGLLVRLGTSSGVATTGYVGGSFQQDADLSSTAGLPVRIGFATDTVYGLMTITLVTGNTWVASHAVTRGSVSAAGGGGIALGGTLDRVRIVTLNGTDTFDAGSINIMYEG